MAAGHKRITKCPVCGGHTLRLERIRCVDCGSAVEGDFTLSALSSLSEENASFAETFILARGNIKDVERRLGISYPTVRSRLDRVIHALGSADVDRAAARRDILTALENDEMDPEEAVAALKSLNDDEPE